MKFIFLDRDGVINEFPGNGLYVTKLKKFHLMPRSLEAIRLLTEAGFTIFVISNQAGVGRNIFSEQKLMHITSNMIRDVEKAGGQLQGFFIACINRMKDADAVSRKLDL